MAIRLIDVDDPSTWPAEAIDHVVPLAERLRGSTEYTSDLSVPIDGEDEFRKTLCRPLVAYHCTRLLDYEAAAIRTEGLRMLSRELVDQRVADARQSGDLGGPAADRLRAANVYARNAQENREGRVCLILGRSVFDQRNNGAMPLLEAWGGEAVNGGPQDARTDPVIGRPSIVVAAIDLSVSWRAAFAAPSLEKLFIASLLGLEDRSGEVHLRSSIAGPMVLDIWQPEDAQYDRHAPLAGL